MKRRCISLKIIVFLFFFFLKFSLFYKTVIWYTKLKIIIIIPEKSAGNTNTEVCHLSQEARDGCRALYFIGTSGTITMG